MPRLWRVVGGVDKGGILARNGQGFQSTSCAERLATGSIVEEQELLGERLHYVLKKGEGPKEGWVSLSAAGKELLVQEQEAEGEADSLLGFWSWGWDERELQISRASSGQLRIYAQIPPVTDIFGILRGEQDGWHFSEMKLRNGWHMGDLRLHLKDETLTFYFRLTGTEDWGEANLGWRGEAKPDAREAREWSPELRKLRETAEAALRAGPGGDGGAAWPMLSCQRLVAWSDLHIDMGENFRHFEAVPPEKGTALIVCGDVCTSLSRLEQAFDKCLEKFDEVFYVPGNHELWADGRTTQDGQRQTSLEKFVEILRLCGVKGVRTSPAFISEGVAVCPLFSWYKANFTGTWVPHAGFDNTTFWPEVDAKDVHNPQLPEIADFFLRLNERRVAAAQSLTESKELKTLWTFSHFLPRPDLNQGNFMQGVLGCTELEDQVRLAGATGHLFGHTHQGTERQIDGIRYVQQPLGYPTDGHREESPLLLWAAGAEGQGSESILACLPAAAAELAADRIRGAMWGALCADSLGMPVHWFYGGLPQIRSVYGKAIKDYTKPVEFYDPSFMIGSITPAIGKVINHGKERYWGPVDESRSQSLGWHHHFSLKAGENTLEGHMLRLYMRLVTAARGGAPDPVHLRDQYIRFMTTRGTHNDNFACVYHRVFFARYAEGIPPEDCPEGGEDIETIESVSTLIPVIMAAARRGPEQAENEIYQTTRVTRKCTRTVSFFGRILSSAMRRILAGESLKDVAEAISAELYPGGGTLSAFIQGRKDPMASTFLVESFPSLLHYMHRYEHSVRDLVLANINVGGENTHRGHILGALAGAAHGMRGIPPEWMDGLVSRREIKKEIEAFVAAVC